MILLGALAVKMNRVVCDSDSIIVIYSNNFSSSYDLIIDDNI